MKKVFIVVKEYLGSPECGEGDYWNLVGVFHTREEAEIKAEAGPKTDPYDDFIVYEGEIGGGEPIEVSRMPPHATSEDIKEWCNKLLRESLVCT